MNFVSGRRFGLLASQMSLVVSGQTGNVPLLLAAHPDTVSCLRSFKTWLHVCSAPDKKQQT